MAARKKIWALALFGSIFCFDLFVFFRFFRFYIDSSYIYIHLTIGVTIAFCCIRLASPNFKSSLAIL